MLAVLPPILLALFAFPSTPRAFLGDLPTAASLADEALRALEEGEPGPEDVFVRLAVATALESTGRKERALEIWKGVEADVQRSGDDEFLPLLAPLQARLHTEGETLSWLAKVKDRKVAASAALGIVRNAVQREEQAAIRSAVGLLGAMHYHGWDPRGDAWASIGWRAAGEPDLARSWTNAVVGRRVYPGEEYAFRSAVEALVEERLRHDDLTEAARIFDEVMKKDEPPGDVDTIRLHFVDWHLGRGEIEAARPWVDALRNVFWRAYARAKVAAALYRGGKAEEASEELRGANEIAGRGLFTRSQVVYVLAAQGIEEPVAELVDDMLEGLDETTSPSDLSQLGGVAALGGRGESLAAIEARLDGEERRKMVVRCASYLDWTGNASSLAVLLDRQTDPETLSEALGAVVMRRVPAREEGFQAELAELALERIRGLTSALDRASLLARIVNVRWVGGK